MTRRSALVVAGALTLAVGLTACGSDSEPKGSGGDPTAALARAKQAFDDASSVHFTMSTDSSPAQGDAVLGADGTLTQQPAFEGEVTALFSGFKADIPIVAVGGKVYAKLPLTTSYAEIDPAEYSAPDPSDFADPDAGISGLLTKLEGAKETGRKRDGKTVVTTYSGKLPGALVAPIIPSADEAGTYRAVVGIDGDGRIATLSVTGDFFEASGDVTYDLTFDDYGKSVTVSKP